MHPALPTLLRIALVFGVGLDYFFVPEPKPVFEIIRKKHRLQFPDSPDSNKVSYHFESLDFAVPQRALNSYLAEFEPIEANDIPLHQYPGIESLFVISGRLQLHFQNAVHELGEKDAVYFDSTAPHGYRRIGARHCSALVATVGS